MSRKNDRDNVFKLVYDFCLTNERDDVLLEDILANNDVDKAYITNVYDGVIKEYDKIKNEIAKYAKSFSIDRIYKVDLAILMLSIYEIKYIEDIPKTVSINEAVNLAKIYSTEKSGPYINGILKNFMK